MLSLHLTFLLPLQSIYTQSSSLQQIHHLKKSFVQTVIFSGCLSFSLIYILPFVFKLIGAKFIPDVQILSIFSVWAALWFFCHVFSIFLNGIGIISIQSFGLLVAIIFPYVVSKITTIEGIRDLFVWINFGLCFFLIICVISTAKFLIDGKGIV
jgi:hypothetical protein